MKKLIKFAFAVVAMAGVVFASASCGKDDEKDIDNVLNKTVTITLDANDGSGKQISIQHKSGDRLPVCEFNPQENLKFAGWVTNPQDTLVTICDTAKALFNKETTLYAVWYWKYDIDHFLRRTTSRNGKVYSVETYDDAKNRIFLEKDHPYSYLDIVYDEFGRVKSKTEYMYADKKTSWDFNNPDDWVEYFCDSTKYLPDNTSKNYFHLGKGFDVRRGIDHFWQGINMTCNYYLPNYQYPKNYGDKGNFLYDNKMRLLYFKQGNLQRYDFSYDKNVIKYKQKEGETVYDVEVIAY